MTKPAPGLDELHARVTDAASRGADALALARAAGARVDAVLELIANGRGVREAGSGLNAASSELLVADALLTEAAARAAAAGTPLREVMRALGLDALAERALSIDARPPVSGGERES